ncbi:MAG TPA: ATP-binding protein [Streptosporangiaceae bacterium]
MWRKREVTKGPDQARLDATARAMIASAPGPIIALGRDRTICVWNAAAEKTFGWTAAEVLGLEPPIIPRELRAEHSAVLERAAGGGGAVSLATRRISKAGEMLDMRVDVGVLDDEDGRRLGWILLCHPNDEDNSVRHYMAERARVVRRLGDVVADMNAELDLEAVLDRIAASLRELTRADAGGFVLIEGDRLRLVSIDGLPAELRGRTADAPTSLVGELMRSGKSVLMRTGESGRFDDLIWSALPGLHTITLSLSHVGGKPYGALYALYSQRKVGHVDLELLELLAGHASVALSNATAFAEVVRQRAHERAVIDGSADGIAVLDGQGLVKQWNPAGHALTGVSAAQAVGKAPPFPLPEPGATLTSRLPNGRWIDVLCTVLEGRDEQVIDFRDITAAKELEEAKDLFLATTSHELRTPITVVQGFASTLASRWDKLLDTDRRAAVQTIAERAQSLAKLVDQLLLGSRAGANRLTVHNEPFDLIKLLTDAANVFRPLSDRHVLATDIPPDLPPAYGDPAATDSIVGQLLENAFKYSPDGGMVTIGARAVPEAGGIEVTVRDEGIGIAPADVERVFERFVQGEAGDRRRFGGIGLGLYIVRQLARAQGGDVTAAPGAGGGTVMTLALRQAGAVTPEPASASPGPAMISAPSPAASSSAARTSASASAAAASAATASAATASATSAVPAPAAPSGSSASPDPGPSPSARSPQVGPAAQPAQAAPGTSASPSPAQAGPAATTASAASSVPAAAASAAGPASVPADRGPADSSGSAAAPGSAGMPMPTTASSAAPPAPGVAASGSAGSPAIAAAEAGATAGEQKARAVFHPASDNGTASSAPAGQAPGPPGSGGPGGDSPAAAPGEAAGASADGSSTNGTRERRLSPFTGRRIPPMLHRLPRPRTPGDDSQSQPE